MKKEKSSPNKRQNLGRAEKIAASLSGASPTPLDLVGHYRQREGLASLIGQNRFPNAVLMSGPKGVGKQSIARRVAQTLLCAKVSTVDTSLLGCLTCPSCVAVQNREHPDLLYLDASIRDESNAEGIRDLIARLAFRPHLSVKRVIIIDNSESLSMVSANLLLKTLEEPPQNNHFILISSSSSKLPITVRSRCHNWRFGTLTADEVKIILQRLMSTEQITLPNSFVYADFLPFLDGSLSGLELLSKEHLDSLQLIEEKLTKILAGDLWLATSVASELTKEKEATRTNLSLLRVSARKLLRFHLERGNSVATYRFTTLLMNIVDAEHLIYDRNLNPSSVLLNSLLSVTSFDGISPEVFFTSEDLVRNITV